MAIKDLTGKVAGGMGKSPSRGSSAPAASPEFDEFLESEGFAFEEDFAADATDDPPIFFRGVNEKKGKAGTERPYSDVVRDFYRLGDKELANMQARLINAGFLDPDDAMIGVHDEASLAAYVKVVDRAAAFYDAGQKVTINDILDRSSEAFVGWDETGRGADDPQVTQLPDRRALAKIADAMSRTTTGRRLDPAQAEAIAVAYEQYVAGNQAHTAAVSEHGGTMRQTYGAQDFAEDQLQQQNPSLVSAREEFDIVSQVMAGLEGIATGEGYGL